MTTKEKLLRPRPRKVDIGGDMVFIRSLTIAEWEAACSVGERDDPQASRDFALFLVSRGVVDESGARVFDSEADPDLTQVPSDVLILLSNRVHKLTTSGTVETIEKN